MPRPRSSNSRALGICAAIAVGTSLVVAAPGALAGPENDSFSARAKLGKALPVFLDESNADATQQSGEWLGRWATGHSIWWEWTSPASEMVTVSSCESDFPTLLGVFEGTSLGHLHRVGLAAPMPGPGCPSPAAEYNFYAEVGRSYVIGVDGDGFYEPGRRGGPLVEPPSGEGRVALRIEPTP
ncbi:MAG TPA: hypothetical protein VGI17_05880 [Solirubrobacterales bacterium]